jgi:hypothetical protein
VIAYYSTVIFKQSVHMSDHLALLMGGFVSLAFFAGTCLSIPVIDRFGRRPVSMPRFCPNVLLTIYTLANVIWSCLHMYRNDNHSGGHV